MPERPDPHTDEVRRKLRGRKEKLPANADRLSRAIFDMPDEEISHEICEGRLSELAQSVATRTALTNDLTAAKHHIDTCRRCADLFSDVLQVVLAEQAGQIPIPAHIPAPDLSFLPVSIPDLVLEWARNILAMLAPAELPSFDRVAQAFVSSLGPQPSRLASKAIPAFGTGFGRRGRTELILAETYVALQRVSEHMSATQIDRLTKEGKLNARLEEHARKAALSLDLDPDAAQAFAREFTRNAGNDSVQLEQVLRQLKEH